jgi:hypothetical protein
MLFTPNYNVIYQGVFHRAKERFKINSEDAEEMRRHGVVEENAEIKRPGRPKKTTV